MSQFVLSESLNIMTIPSGIGPLCFSHSALCIYSHRSLAHVPSICFFLIRYPSASVRIVPTGSSFFGLFPFLNCVAFDRSMASGVQYSRCFFPLFPGALPFWNHPVSPDLIPFLCLNSFICPCVKFVPNFSFTISAISFELTPHELSRTNSYNPLG